MSVRGALPFRNLVASTLFGAAGLAVACGGRDGPLAREYGPPLVGWALTACYGDSDCGPIDRCAPMRCVGGTCVADAPVVCVDGDDCTEDRCVSETGVCEFRSLSMDEDGDGHTGPRPGYRPGEAGACGDDCDDTSALAFPGSPERCDGVDNDCNGVVDDGAGYMPVSEEPVLLSSGARQAGWGGISRGGDAFAVSYGAQHDTWETTFTAFDESGAIRVPSVALTHVNTDSFAGPLVWTGSEFGTAWEDRRDGDFEIYFNRVDAQGNKLGPDVRVTEAPEFSLRPDLIWDGAEYVVVWHDRREDPDRGRIYGQRIASDGSLLGDNVPLTPYGTDADDVGIAQSHRGFGITFNEQQGSERQLVFRTVSIDLAEVGAPVVLSPTGAASSSIVWNGDRYVVVWGTKDVVPGPSILGAALGVDGTVLIAAKAVSGVAPFARSSSIVPLGDRLLFAWAEERNDSYDIYTKMLSSDLQDLSVAEVVTSGSSDALDPGLALGPTGVAGLIYVDDKTGAFQVYATRLFCNGVP